MAMWNLFVVLVWLMPLVAAGYNCSGSNSKVNPPDYKEFIQVYELAAVNIQQASNRTHNITISSKTSGRNVSAWNVCSASNKTRGLCMDCLDVLMKDLYTVCVTQRSTWGGMNLGEECSMAYSAPDFRAPGWFDELRNALPPDIAGFLQPVSVDADAAHTVFPAHKLYSISFPALLFNTFFSMYQY